MTIIIIYKEKKYELQINEDDNEKNNGIIFYLNRKDSNDKCLNSTAKKL